MSVHPPRPHLGTWPERLRQIRAYLTPLRDLPPSFMTRVTTDVIKALTWTGTPDRPGLGCTILVQPEEGIRAAQVPFGIKIVKDRGLQRLARAGVMSLLIPETAALLAYLNQGNGISPHLPP